MESSTQDSAASSPPGPRGLGELHALLFESAPVDFLRRLVESFGDVVAFDLAEARCILVQDADAIRELFLERWRDVQKPEAVKRSNRGYWGDGLTTLESDAWRARRTALLPLFASRRLESRLAMTRRYAFEMIDGWSDGGALDLRAEFERLVARLSFKAVLDADVDDLVDAETSTDVVPWEEALGEDFPPVDATDAPGRDRRRRESLRTRPRAGQRIDGILSIIDERFASREQRGDVLSDLVAMEQRGELARKDVIDEVLQMLFAGHLTTTYALVGFCRDLALRGAMAEVVRTEARQAVPRDLRTLMASDCLAFLKESLRLRPPSPILFRQALRRMELGGYEIQAGTQIWVAPALVHRDPRYFDGPDRFEISRFGSNGKTPPHLFLPFGTGPRLCIAHRQAYAQMALVGSILASRVRFELADDGADEEFYVEKIE